MKRTIVLVLAVLSSACADVTAPPIAMPPAAESAVPAERLTRFMFRDYVAMGTSIAAGFMSGGISGETQLQAYPVLLARAAEARFVVPLLAEPGCPQPWAAPLQPWPAPPSCAGRATPFRPPVVSNVSVPGQTVAEVLSGTGGIQPLPGLFLFGRTQVEAMALAKPTFVTVDLGDNDAFRAALSGFADQLTPLPDFAAAYGQVVAAVAGSQRLQGAALVGVVNPLLAMPLLQPGAFFFAASDEGLFLGKPVNPNCSPLNPLSANLISYAIFADAAFPEVNCDPNAYEALDPRRGAYLLDGAEQAAIQQRVTQYNAVIATAAAERAWAFFDPNAIVMAALASRDGFGRADQLRKCQDLATAFDATTIQAAVLDTCPVPGPTGAPNLFGSLVSFDGIHPSAAGHQGFASGLAAAIDARYGTTLALP